MWHVRGIGRLTLINWTLILSIELGGSIKQHLLGLRLGQTLLGPYTFLYIGVHLHPKVCIIKTLAKFSLTHLSCTYSSHSNN